MLFNIVHNSFSCLNDFLFLVLADYPGRYSLNANSWLGRFSLGRAASLEHFLYLYAGYTVVRDDPKIVRQNENKQWSATPTFHSAFKLHTIYSISMILTVLLVWGDFFTVSCQITVKKLFNNLEYYDLWSNIIHENHTLLHSGGIQTFISGTILVLPTVAQLG